ncbi:hypothetical protein GGQ60_000713 [Pedobacter zeae]|uniref:Uncharacterized protein n=1 Tax=Pedobacter zeae TaxID=1737356 RepID=A0A7W6K7Q6_9SPHI|nr:hypothetical protein [Pedobacter zeae]
MVLKFPALISYIVEPTDMIYKVSYFLHFVQFNQLCKQFFIPAHHTTYYPET